MRRTEPWWVCRECGEPVARVGKAWRTKHQEHLRKCPKAGYGIKRIEQRKRA